MPVAKHLRHHYSGNAWAETRARILKRDHNRCTACLKPNDATVSTITGKRDGVPFMLWRSARRWMNERGWPAHWDELAIVLDLGLVKREHVVRLQVAHRNNVAGDDRDENLVTFCGWCHLMFDKQFHKATRRRNKDAKRPLFMEAA